MAAAKSNNPKIQSTAISLGMAPAGTTVVFKVHDDPGFVAHAILLRETQTIATWVSTELLGVQISEPLVIPGFYTLQITIVFTSKTPSTVTIDFSLGGASKVKQVRFTGKVPEVARAIADVFIV